jgi:hypothetical protein
MGHLIPAGTGLKKYRNVLLKNEITPPVETAEEPGKVEVNVSE